MTTARNWTGRVFVGVTLDGFIARPDGGIDHLTAPPTGPRHHQPESSSHALEWDTFYPDIDHLVMGRGTYEKALTFDDWPYADKRVVVLSTTLVTEDPRVTVVASLDALLDLLADRSAREVYVDGGQVIRSFLRRDLVDEITIGWVPQLIGRGLPLFGELDRDVPLELVATHAASGGIVHVTYRVHR